MRNKFFFGVFAVVVVVFFVLFVFSKVQAQVMPISTLGHSTVYIAEQVDPEIVDQVCTLPVIDTVLDVVVVDSVRADAVEPLSLDRVHLENMPLVGLVQPSNTVLGTVV
jgi:hypothetical protein